MSSVLWWVCQIGFLGAGAFFLLFGVLLLVGAYGLDNPFNFVMTFFASNLIILISATVMAGLVIRMLRRARSENINE